LLLNEVHTEDFNAVISPYNLFKYAVRTEITRRYYERWIRTFFDFIGISLGTTTEERCNLFAQKGKIDMNWALSNILKFVYYQRERVDKKEISGATVRNYTKIIRLFCEMADIPIQWKKITRGLPRGKKYADDRILTLEELKNRH
jgi:hypothetical protein